MQVSDCEYQPWARECFTMADSPKHWLHNLVPTEWGTIFAGIKKPGKVDQRVADVLANPALMKKVTKSMLERVAREGYMKYFGDKPAAKTRDGWLNYLDTHWVAQRGSVRDTHGSRSNFR